MTLLQIAILGAGAALLGWLTRRTMRVNLLLTASVLALFWLQPSLPLRFLDFWLATVTLALACLGWIVTTPAEVRSTRENWTAAAIVAALVLLLDLTRYLGLDGIFTSYRTPQIVPVAIVLAVAALLVLGAASAKRAIPALLWTLFGLLLVIFIAIKIPALAQAASLAWRALMQQSTEKASGLDLRWFGYSYIAFRILHTIRDRQSGRLPAVSLGEYLVYAIFFPALPAGPIDRLDRFIKDLRQPVEASAENIGQAARRFLVGLTKKFVVAGFLSMFALSADNFTQVRSTGWAWVLLFAYALLLYFDFSGYTDLAIGLGLAMGIRLPENFNAPYLKPNLTQFWSNWHMTLTQWFRAYYFNPLTRSLRGLQKPPSIPVIILITQVSTMVLIGLWHGVTLNFVIWGVWHGLGQFAQNRWSDWVKPYAAKLAEKPALQTAMTVLSTGLTFLYVALGWVWFVLPAPADAFAYFGRLFGFGA
jgi:D-alanyl-lipoteichoic acid acyltransferase DltB (MBOAT superfamily)